MSAIICVRKYVVLSHNNYCVDSDHLVVYAQAAGHHRAQGLGALPNPATGRLTFLAIDTDTGESDENGLLGTDFMFFTAFFGKFVQF